MSSSLRISTGNPSDSFAYLSSLLENFNHHWPHSYASIVNCLVESGSAIRPSGCDRNIVFLGQPDDATDEECLSSLQLLARKTTQQLEKPLKYLTPAFKRGIYSANREQCMQAAHALVDAAIERFEKAPAREHLSPISRAAIDGNLFHLKHLLHDLFSSFAPIAFERLEENPVYHAILHGREKIVESLLNCQAIIKATDVNATDSEGNTLLHLAVSKKLHSVCSLLVKDCCVMRRPLANPLCKNSKGESPLMASLSQDEKMALMLLENKEVEECGAKELIEMALKADSAGYFEFMKALSGKSARIKQLLTAHFRQFYSLYKNGRIAHLLLSQSAKEAVEAIRATKQNAFIRYAIAREWSAVLELLHERGFDQLNPQRNPTHVLEALKRRSFSLSEFFIQTYGYKGIPLALLEPADALFLLNLATRKEDIRIIEGLLEECCEDLSAEGRTDFLSSLLHAAVSSNRMESVVWLYKQGADINSRDQFDKTPLHKAAANGNAEIFQFLLKHKAKWKTDATGKTPFHHLCRHKTTTLFVNFYDSPARLQGLYLPDKDSLTPLYYAAAYNTPEFFQSLTFFFDARKFADFNFLSVAADNNNEAMAAYFLDNNFVYDVIDNRLKKPIEYSLHNGGDNISKLMIEKALKDKNAAFLAFALEKIVQIGNTALLQVFIDRSFSFSGSFPDGPLLLQAASHGHVEMTEKLIQQECRINEKHNGHSALDMAVFYGHQSTASLLIKHGAKIHDDIDSNFNTILFATVFKHFDLLGIILKHTEQKRGYSRNKLIGLLTCVLKYINKDYADGVFQIRLPDWNIHYGGESVGKLYERITNESVLLAAKELVRDFDQSMEFLAQRRRLTATHYNNGIGTRLFGLSREDGHSSLETPTGDRYIKYGKKLLDIDIEKNAPFLKDVVKTGPAISGQIIANINGKTIPLTRFSYDEEIKDGRWIHTDVDFFPDLLPSIKEKYNAILAMDSGDRDALLRAIGDFHWHLSQLTLYNRGSAAITDQMTKLLWTHHGYRTFPWAVGCIPDCEALATPNPQDFADNYASLMDRIPEKYKKTLSSPLNAKVKILVKIFKQHQLTKLENLLPMAVAKYLEQEAVVMGARGIIPSNKV